MHKWFNGNHSTLHWLSAALAFVLVAFLSNKTMGQDLAVSAKPFRLVNGRLGIELKGKDIESVQVGRISIWLADANPATMPAVSGTPVQTKDSIRFESRFGLSAGKKYRVRLFDRNGRQHELFVSIPKGDLQPPKVVAIHPSASEVPANMLKFYVHFSQPMRRGSIYKHVKLLKKDGSEIELPFLEIEQEFWSRDGLRLTLLLDPGRVKRGLKPRMEMGPIFEPNQTYQLVISGKWENASGTALGKDIVKSYRITAEINTRLSVENWNVSTPQSGTRARVELNFDRILDQALLQRLVTVFKQDQQIQGKFEAARDARSLWFTPQQPWRPGKYHFQLSPELEDVCGNSLAKPFDVDVFEKIENSPTDAAIRLPFAIKN